LIAGVIVLVGVDLGFLEVLLADNGFLSELPVEERDSVLAAFRFCLGGVNGSEEEAGDGELVSVLTGMVRGDRTGEALFSEKPAMGKTTMHGHTLPLEWFVA
jgi:hypothetical protein